jgi:uncharacterized protein
MLKQKYTTIAAVCAAMLFSVPSFAAHASPAETLTIDQPVHLKPSKVVFNMDHLAFAGDQSIGLLYMKLMAEKYKAANTPLQIVAVFHGAAGYMLLKDSTYDKVRKTTNGNPYKQQIASLQKQGIAFEECGETAKSNKWTNVDLLPDVKVNTGANLRIVELVQDGFVQLQP